MFADRLFSSKAYPIVLLLILAVLIQACGVVGEPLPAGVAPAVVAAEPTSTVAATPLEFDGEIAYQHVATQLEFGPRTPGSAGHDQIVDWMVAELQLAGWDAGVQEIPSGDYTIQNVIAKRGSGDPWIIIGAHYDTRIYADQDPDPEKRTEPVPGANDGASGVAVLLELARVLPADLDGEVWLVFFDAEDNGYISGWDWIMGSTAFVDALDGQPDAAVIADMIGDANLNIFWEPNSNEALTLEIWDVAESLGYADSFIPSFGPRMLDDHTPFLRAGIHAVDIIDFDYAYWHTIDDTIDKVSPESLKKVGDVLHIWLLTKLSTESTP